MKHSDAQPGPVLIGTESTELSSRERDWLQHPLVGGVVLFTRNYRDPHQLEDLTSSIRDAAHARMLICVDHEGGRVQRFRDEFTNLPPLALLGRMHDDAPEMACDFAYRHGRVMATELLVRGVDHSFAPVLDLDVESRVIGDRAFHTSATTVADLARYYIAGMHDAGMAACGKHFPGHGSVEADSHTDDVVDERPRTLIEAADLVPFAQLSKQLDAVMMAHVIYPEIDHRPAGYSSVWIQEVLRGSLAYEGVVFSDDLGMQAAVCAGKLRDRLELSLKAGCDAALVCQPEDVAQLLEDHTEPLSAKHGVFERLYGRNRLTLDELASVGEWKYWQQSIIELEQTKWA